MKKEVKNNSFVFYASYLEAVETLEKAYPDMAAELLRAIINYGIYGDYDKTNPLIETMMVNIGFGIDKANDRYKAAVENGKKGGRTKIVDDEKVEELKDKGLTNKEVANELKCSVSSIEKANKRIKENRKNRKNLNYNDNYNNNDNVNINDTDNKKNGLTVLEGGKPQGSNVDMLHYGKYEVPDNTADLTVEEYGKLMGF